MNNFGPARAFTVYAADSTKSWHYRTSALTVRFTSTDTTVIKVDSVATIAAGQGYVNSQTYTTIGAGIAQIIATAPGHLPDTATITVITPKLQFSNKTFVVGRRQTSGTNAFWVRTPDVRATAVNKTLLISDNRNRTQAYTLDTDEPVARHVTKPPP